VVPRSDDNGGESINGYELWVDSGNNYASNFVKLVGYTGSNIVY